MKQMVQIDKDPLLASVTKF